MSKVHVKILKAARKKIQTRSTMYLCYAVAMASENENLQEAGHEIINQIRNDLQIPGCLWTVNSLEEWLHVKRVVPLPILPSTGKMRRTRMRWAKDLIKYWRHQP